MKGLIFTYLLTYGGALFALFNPFAGLLIYVSFAIIKPDALWEFSVAPGNYSRIVFFGMFIGWLIKGGGNWRLGRAWIPTLSIAGYLVWCLASAYAAPDQELAWSSVEATAKIVIPIVIGVSLINSVAQLEQLAWVIVLSQGYLALEFNRSYYDGFNRLVQLGFAGLEEKTVAMTMVVGAAVAVFLALTTKRLSLRVLALILAGLMIHVPMFTFSRSGIMALICMGTIALWLVPKRPIHIIVIAAAIALGFRLAGAEVRARFATSFAEESERDFSAQSRIELAGQAWDTMLRYPILGIGPRHWLVWSQSEYGWPKQKAVHNSWLESGAEVGFPGVVALASFFVITILRVYPIARSRGIEANSREAHIARMVICATGGYFIASQFLTVYGIEVPYHVTLMGVGLLKLTTPPPERQPAHLRLRRDTPQRGDHDPRGTEEVHSTKASRVRQISRRMVGDSAAPCIATLPSTSRPVPFRDSR